MSFLSAETISRAIGRLRSDVHPFLGITYFACKKAGLPVGAQAQVSVDDLTRNHLDEHHLFGGISEYYFQPFKSVKFWVERKYPSAGLQAINTQTFGDVFEHKKGDPRWGFASNFVVVLAGKLRSLGYRRKPRLIDLASWLYKDEQWIEPITARALIDRLINDYVLSVEEVRALFDTEEGAEVSSTDVKPPAYEYLKHFDSPPDAPAEVGGTLVELTLNHVGPADSLALDLGDRITLITGDNGLGKSFLLECAWWAATADWAHDPAYPGADRKAAGFEPTIEFTIKNKAAVSRRVSVPYNWAAETWADPRDRQRLLALGVFSAADGSFSVYDPSQPRGRGRKRSVTLSQSDIWNPGSKDIEGIVRDWRRWEQSEDQFPFQLFSRIIARLSPEDLGELQPGKSVRIPGDRRDIPTLQHIYGTTPIVFESAGVKRILALAYLITWTLYEHRLAAAQRQEAPLDRMIVIIDELESHLHPKWQRTILPALIESLSEIGGISSSQILVATHSPLVLSSIETLFDQSEDRSYHFTLNQKRVVLEELEYSKQGDVAQWLTSPFIGLSYARSKTAEAAVADAVALQEQDRPTKEDVKRVHARLRVVLADTDKFWPRWTYFAARFGVGA